MAGITNLIKGALNGGKIAEVVAGAVDNLTLSKEEKEQFKIDVQRISLEHEANQLKELETVLKDVGNARDNNARIQEAEHASWMAKNIAYILDVTFTVSFIAMLFVIIYKQVPETNKELFYTSFGLLGGYVSQILGFHRGTSKGSEDKSKELKKLRN